MKKFEELVNKSIPWLIIPFTILLIIDIIFDLSQYFYQMIILDSLIIFILVVDLHFKYKKYKSKKEFFKEYRLDFFALIPYFFYFRLVKLIRLLRVAKPFTRFNLYFIAKTKATYHLMRKKRKNGK